jgi:hypothetical protein
MLLLHNHTQLHARASYEDGDLPHEKRHLVRLQLSPETAWLLPPALKSWYGNCSKPGARGGVNVPKDRYRILTEPPAV